VHRHVDVFSLLPFHASGQSRQCACQAKSSALHKQCEGLGTAVLNREGAASPPVVKRLRNAALSLFPTVHILHSVQYKDCTFLVVCACLCARGLVRRRRPGECAKPQRIWPLVSSRRKPSAFDAEITPLRMPLLRRPPRLRAVAENAEVTTLHLTDSTLHCWLWHCFYAHF